MALSSILTEVVEYRRRLVGPSRGMKGFGLTAAPFEF